MANLRSISDVIAHRKTLFKREADKFKAIWYLERWFEKFIFLLGALSFIALIIYGIYLLL